MGLSHSVLWEFLGDKLQRVFNGPIPAPIFIVFFPPVHSSFGLEIGNYKHFCSVELKNTDGLSPHMCAVPPPPPNLSIAFFVLGVGE